MKDYADLKFVSIGFGFLAGYLYPCYSRFCKPEKIGSQIAAVTADADTLEFKRQKYAFPIFLDENEKALRQVNPDVILFSPPPAVAPKLAKEVLKPYYDSLRDQGKGLPDLYAFPPSPQGKFYVDLLGKDVHVCNILPNMTREIAGKDLHGAEGNTYVTLPKESTWPEENLQILEKIFEPLGGIVYSDPDNIQDILASMCAAEVIPWACFAITDSLKREETKWDSGGVAGIMRGIHQDTWRYYPDQAEHLCIDGVKEEIREKLKQFLSGWTQGGIDYLCSIGLPSEKATSIMVSNVDLRLHVVQLESREEVENALAGHATKGGVAERGRLCYEILAEERIKAEFTNGSSSTESSEFGAFCKNISFEICRIVATHSRRMAGNEIPVRYTPEHHAILYGLFVRNAVKLAGQDGKKAVHAGTLLYADQRGSRMAKRCLEHGDPLDPFGYMAYGEWAPEPGTMEAEDVSFEPDVITQAYTCPWLTAWEQMGFLKEGVEYCSCIDYNLVKGFNRNLELTVESTRTEGAECCRFVWKGFSMDEEARKALAKKKTELSDSCRKDWLYHTRHIYSAMSSQISLLPQGKAIIDKTLDDFGILYGKSAREAVCDVDHIDFYQI